MRLVSLHLPGPGGSLLAPWSAVLLRAVCVAAARTKAIDCCFCRHHERSRRSLRRWLALTGCPLAISTRQVTQKKALLREMAAWWLWFRRGMNTRVCLQKRARLQTNKTNDCQCTGPFGWTDQPEPLCLCLSDQAPGIPAAQSTNPKARKKVARHAHLSPCY